jgi:hypothetical protein
MNLDIYFTKIDELIEFRKNLEIIDTNNKLISISKIMSQSWNLYTITERTLSKMLFDIHKEVTDKIDSNHLVSNSFSKIDTSFTSIFNRMKELIESMRISLDIWKKAQVNHVEISDIIIQFEINSIFSDYTQLLDTFDNNLDETKITLNRQKSNLFDKSSNHSNYM